MLQAFRTWTPEYIAATAQAAGKAALHTAFASNSSNVFGPYYDPTRPMARLPGVKRRAVYDENASVDVASLLGVGPTHCPHRFAAFSGDLEDLGHAIAADAAPLDELLRVKPARTSVNVWIGQRRLCCDCPCV